MTNKKFKLAAMSLATAVAVSTVGPSASAVTYQLENGDVTVAENENGAFSYQGEDKDENRTYVDKDTEDNGQIIIKQTEGTTTDNTVTVEENVTNKNGDRDVDIIIDGVNVDTSDTSTSTDTPTEVATDTGNTGDKTIIKVGEGADVDLTVKDSNLTTGGNGIDIGVNLKDGDDNKETNVDLTLDNTKINLTENATAGINARDNSDVDITLKGDNTIDGSEAIDKVTEGGGHDISKDNVNIEGIRVGGEGASDSSDASEGANTKLTISGGVEKTETAETDTEETESPAGGSLTISDTTGGLVMADGSDVEITDGANVTIEETKTSGSTQAGRGVTQHGDLTISGGSSLTIDGVEDNAKQASHTGIGIASWDDITVEDGSTLEISDATTGIYGHQGSDASLTVEDSALNIAGSSFGIDYEGAGKDKEGNVLKSAGDITFDNAEVDINITPETPNAAGYGIAAHGDSNITFKNGTEAEIKVTSENPDAGTWGIYNERGGTGNLTVNDSTVDIDANRGIYAGFQKVEIANNSVVTSKNTHQAMYALGGSDGKGLKLRVTGNSRYHLTGGTRGNWGIQATSARGHEILVDDNGQLISDMENSYTAVGLGKNAKLVVDNGTVLVRGKYDKAGLFAYGDNSTIHIKNNSHVEATTITLNPSIKKIPTVGQKLIVTGGTLTYDYKADNTLWPENEQGDKLTNFLLTKDDTHANFDALSYKGQTYTYLSDLNKETGKQYLSVWVPAAALNYMLDVDGSHDPEIIGKVLEELKQAGYNFGTAYQTAENGDQVVILRDMVVNGKSLNFTKTTDAEGNTKLIWGNYEKQAEGAPSAYDMVYGTEYEYEGKTYTIVWGYESQNNPNTTAAAGVLDAFGPDSNVKVTGETIDGTDSAQYTVTIYGALREVTDPVIPTNPEPETPEDSDPTPPAPAPTTPTTPAVQDARPTTPAVEQAVAKTTPAPETPVNPPVQDARPESGKLIQTGTTNWMADVLVRAGGVLLAAGYLLERKRKSMFHKAQH
ncbi:carbohydrate-binding domain-containing protein [Faecalibacterium sp. CLA-AA-H283]|uniref:carbohydrate-binding domain-containing protein n=1 Tax=Faecalibacterium TaxID=216851 RepID=UPI001D0E6DC7|nr:carbohydrate-binding domain-containing protein [Faecalibacterium hominis (ex Afrizal et al. 2022)]MCC2138098.1 carbohydrate-binding domain-containing protein [Faecalibacterium hominis (ex Afrizal et al. 2022)]